MSCGKTEELLRIADTKLGTKMKIVINELMDVEKGKREVRRESVMKNKEYKTVIQANEMLFGF